ARPFGVAEVHVGGGHGGGPAEVDVEVAADLELAPGACFHLALDRPLEPVPVPQRDQQRDRDRKQGQQRQPRVLPQRSQHALRHRLRCCGRVAVFHAQPGLQASSLVRSPCDRCAAASPTVKNSVPPVYTGGELPVTRERSTSWPSGSATRARPSSYTTTSVSGSQA